MNRGRDGRTAKATEITPAQMAELGAMVGAGHMDLMTPEMRADMEWAERQTAKLRAN